MTDSFAVGQWVLGTPGLVVESLQIAPLKLKNGNPSVATTEACFCPFDLSSQQESATRKNLDLRLSEDWASMIENMETNIVNLVAGESERYVTQKLELEDVQQRFKSTLHKRGEYPHKYTCKGTYQGNLQCKILG